MTELASKIENRFKLLIRLLEESGPIHIEAYDKYAKQTYITVISSQIIKTWLKDLKVIYDVDTGDPELILKLDWDERMHMANDVYKKIKQLKKV